MSDWFTPEAEKRIAKDLAEDACTGKDISEQLNAIPYEERLSIARQMESYSKERTDLPDLQLTVGNDIGGNEHLKDIRPNDGYMWDTDVYNMPVEGLGSMSADTAADVRVNEAFNRYQGDTSNVSGEMRRWQAVQRDLRTSVSERLGK